MSQKTINLFWNRRMIVFFLWFSIVFILSSPAWSADSGADLKARDDLTVQGTEGTENDPDLEVKGYSAFATTPTNASSVTSGAGNVYVEGSMEIDGNLYPAGTGIWDTAGNLGIGTTSPAQSLDVRGEAYAYLFRDQQSQTYYLDPGNTGTSLAVAGKVGIGTTNPLIKLDVIGDIRTSGNLTSPYGGIGTYQNLLKYSEAFEDATSGTSWVETNLTVTAGSVNGPDGSTNTADTLTSTVADGYIEQSYDTGSALTGRAFTFSVWLKTSSGTVTSRLKILSANSTPGNTTVSVSTIWNRYSVTGTFGTDAATIVKAQIIPVNASTGSVIAWGAQLEEALSIGVYVQTEATAVTTASMGLVTNADLRMLNLNLGESGAINFGADSQLLRSGADTVATASGDNLLIQGNLQVTGTGPHYISTGNVGIGTTGPGAKLDVVGGAISVADGQQFRLEGAAGDTYIVRSAAGSMSLFVDANEIAVFKKQTETR